MITAGELRKLVADLPDDQKINVNITYGEVAQRHVYVRIDRATTERARGDSVSAPGPGIHLTISLVSEEDVEEDPERFDGQS